MAASAGINASFRPLSSAVLFSAARPPWLSPRPCHGMAASCPMWQNCFDADGSPRSRGSSSAFGVMEVIWVKLAKLSNGPGLVWALKKAPVACSFGTVMFDAMSASRFGVWCWLGCFSFFCGCRTALASLERAWWAFVVLSLVCSGASWLFTAQVTAVGSWASASRRGLVLSHVAPLNLASGRHCLGNPTPLQARLCQRLLLPCGFP